MTQSYDLGKTFGINAPEGFMVPGRADQSNPSVPSLDASHVFDPVVLRPIIGWMMSGMSDGLCLTGPTGAGKSSTVCQIASRLHIPVQRINAHSRLEFPEMVGQQVLIDGDMLFQDGPLTTAMRQGHWFLLDEFDLLDPSTAAGLNAILEGAPLVIPENGGEIVTPDDHFRFIVTGNSAGGGDRTGQYQGVLMQNAAFMDRFITVEVGYPVKATEMDILAKAVPKMHERVRETMVDYANSVRSLFMGTSDAASAIEVTLSTRSLVRWAKLTEMFQGLSAQGINPVEYSLELTLTNRANPATKAALKENLQRHFGQGGQA